MVERSEGPKRARSIPPNDPALANVRHELGTPLHQIVGFSELLLMQESSEVTAQTREALEAIARSARRLRAVFHEIVSLAEAAGGQAQTPAFMPAHELVAEVAFALRERGAPFDVELVHAASDDTAAQVPHVASTVLATLAMQLARVFPRAHIQMGCDADDGHVTLRIEATAPDLDGALLASLLDASVTPSRRRGLDLASRLRMAIVQELLAAHAGTLGVRGEHGHSTFELVFDRAQGGENLAVLGAQLQALRMRFLAAVGHDLRSPLNAIQGFADLLLLDAAVPSAARESLTIVQRAAQELLARIDRMVAWARVRAATPDA